MRKLNEEQLKNKIHEINSNIAFDYNEYENNKSKINFYCKKHNYSFESTVVTFIYKKSLGCYYCKKENNKYGGSKVPKEEIIKTVNNNGLIYINHHYEDGRCKIEYLCPNHKDKGTQLAYYQDIKNGKKTCGYCNGTKRTTEDFQDEINKIFDNKISLIGEYTGARNTIECKCNIDNHIWKPYAYNLLSGYGCPICANKKVGKKKRKSDDSRLKELSKINSDIDILKLGKRSHDKSICKCKKCGNIWEASYTNLTHKNNNTGCPKCGSRISKNEKRIAGLLSDLGISFIMQYTFDDCVDKNKLPFDFYLPEYNVAIEYDGEHHYLELFDSKRFTKKERLEYFKRHDKIKTLYCKEHNIKLIRIPYWDSNNLQKYINMSNINI